MAQRPLTAEVGSEPASCDLRPLSFRATSSPPSLVPAWPIMTNMLVSCTVDKSARIFTGPFLFPFLCLIGDSLIPWVTTGTGTREMS